MKSIWLHDLQCSFQFQGCFIERKFIFMEIIFYYDMYVCLYKHKNIFLFLSVEPEEIFRNT